MKVTATPVVVGAPMSSSPFIGNKRTSGDHLDNKISQNTEKSPGDLKRLVVTQSPVKKPLVNCCGPVKGPEERLELGFTWNKEY